MTLPPEVWEALQVEVIAQRYHVSPVDVVEMPAWLLRHIKLADMGADALRDD